MKDLFGIEIDRPQKKGPKRYSWTRAYAAEPGTGPEGESCKTCNFYSLIHYSRDYRKCGLRVASWTHGPGSDILASSPACSKWEPKSND